MKNNSLINFLRKTLVTLGNTLFYLIYMLFFFSVSFTGRNFTYVLTTTLFWSKVAIEN